MVEVPDSLVNGQLPFWKNAFILRRNFIRIMRAQSKKDRDEWLFAPGHLLRHELQHGFVVNSPNTIRVFRLRIFVQAIVTIEPHPLRENVEIHRTVLSPVKKARIITLSLQQGTNPVKALKLGAIKGLVLEVRKHGQDRGERIDGPSAVGKAVF